jgi:hypothetical protein
VKLIILSNFQVSTVFLIIKQQNINGFQRDAQDVGVAWRIEILGSQPVRVALIIRPEEGN